MTIDDLIKLYEEKKKEFGSETYKYISDILAEAKITHIRDYIKKQARAGRRREDIDPEQSWRAFKGKNFERLILHIIEDQVSLLGLKCTKDAVLDRTRLSEELSRVRRNLVVHYGPYDLVPDTDIIIYDPKNYTIVAVVSCKITLRERIAQTAYWKLKLKGDPVTENIKVFFVTPDEDGHLVRKDNPSKGRIIVEFDLDCAYVLRDVQENENVKMFDKFITDLRGIVDEINKKQE